MAYDEGIAERLREVYAEEPFVVEKKMFGGLAFMVDGHMSCGIVDERLMVRVGPEVYEDVLKRPYVSKMDFTGKPLRGFIYVESDGFAEDLQLEDWVQMSLTFIRSLPPK